MFTMFTDQTFEPVGFETQITSEKSENTSIVQTEPILNASKESQNIEQRSASTQTTEATKPEIEVNYDNLASFLKRVTPGVLDILDEVYGSNAFEGYNPHSSDEPSARVQLLSSFYTLGDSNTDKKLSDLSWSTGGGFLVVSHSVIHHETWCNHLSEIKFYKISGDDKLEETPNKTLEVQSCVTNLAYHPTEPAILAAGLFNGDVLLWNLRDDEFVAPLQICVHSDMVTSLLWLPKSLSDSVIVTTSSDGFIYINGITRNFTNVTVHKRFKISKEHNPAENSRPRSSSGKRERAVEAGLSLTCLDFSLISPGIFVVGTLCGGIYKCSLENPIPIDSGDIDDSEYPLGDPVVSEYERHEGSVTCIKCSPTRNIFLTCGTDKEIRLYNIDQTNRLQTINVEQTVVKFSWYPKGTRDIIGAYGASSSVDFYDAANGKVISKLRMESARQNTSCLDFNMKRDLAAVGDTKGKLEIWRISRQAIP
ncbi:cytoplasmic dynein 2 intermediate chain 2-like [Venturia canescens]|uniref:cytoplasmic dynein 2 intermediate chain 2-like n=1 Tax=Venturia canescens TaxID=32260 RepID=UPI001C9C5ACF|nr:cytoplasmic dynein 2 intermediate chain 2-like [Venturia canescens]